MKTIHRTQYFLFAVILLGMFASFAQNEYSSILLSYPYLFIGILFFIEMYFSFIEFRKNQSSMSGSFLEPLALGIYFCGIYFMSTHWTGANLSILVGGLIILILYAGFAIKMLSKKSIEEKKRSIILFCLAFGSCLAVIAYTFKLLHLVFADQLIVLSAVFSFIFLLLVIFNILKTKEAKKRGLKDYFGQTKTRLVLSFIFFSFWTIYFTLVSCGMAPRLYSLANPFALEKMYQEQNPLADVYRKNYQQFLNNRNAENNKQKNNLGSKK